MADRRSPLQEGAPARSSLPRALGAGILAVILAACGGTPASPSPSAAGSPAASAPAASTAASPPPAAGTGTIRVGIDIGAEKQQQWLPWHNFGQDYGLQWCAQKLVSVAPDGTIINDMAESFEVSADGKTYTFKLRAREQVA